MKVIDTSVAVDHLRGDTGAVDLLQRLVDQDEQLAASELVRFELLAGVRSDELNELEQFCSALSWIPVDEDVARIAGSLARDYRKAHRGVDDVDYLVAATALALEAELLTTNVRHFPMVRGLQAAY